MKKMQPVKARRTYAFTLILLAFSLFFAKSNAQTNNYFGGSGALNGPNWSTHPSGPYNQAFNTAGGGIAHFNVAGSMSGGSITVAGIEANQSVTLITSSGTISNQSNSVIQINVDADATLDFGSQAFTSSGSAGYIKNGDGVLAMAGNTYGGGFTLNAGTIIVRGINAMGGGSANSLTINGGTIAANANRDLSGKFNGGIVVNGNFTLGAISGLANPSANLTFGNTVSLGNEATRIITIGGTGTYTFNAPISGYNSNLIIDNTSNGIVMFRGENTYSGITTINGGVVQLNRVGGGTLLGANSIIVNEGTLRISSDQVLNDLSIGAGASLIVDSGVRLTINGTCVLASSSITNAGTIQINDTLKINQGAEVSHSGVFLFGESSTLVLNHSSGIIEVTGTTPWWPAAQGPRNVSITHSSAGILLNNISRTVLGIFQTHGIVQQSGNGSLVLGGDCRIDHGGEFEFAPHFESTSTLIYASGGTYARGPEWSDTDNTNPGRPHHVLISNNTTLNYPNGNIASRFVNGDLTIESGAALHMDYGSPGMNLPLSVQGNLVLQGSLSLGDAPGGDLRLAGNWEEDSASLFISNQAIVVLSDGFLQTISKSGGENAFYRLSLEKSGGEVQLSNNVQIENQLRFAETNQASVRTNDFEIILSSVASNAIQRLGNGHIIGKLQRAAKGSATYLFSLGTDEGYTPISISFDGADGIFRATAMDGAHPDFVNSGLDTGKYISRCWDLEEVAGGFNHANITFTYQQSDLRGGASPESIQTAKYVLGEWTHHSTSSIAYSFTTAALTRFGSFMGGEAQICPIPHISHISPNPVSRFGNQPLQIFGSNFSSSGNTVWKDGQQLMVLSESTTLITLSTPPDLCPGTIVVNNACGQTSDPFDFDVFEPMIESISNDILQAGDTIRLFGVHFGNSHNVVRIADAEAIVYFENNTEIQAIVPYGIPCSGDIAVEVCGQRSNFMPYTLGGGGMVCKDAIVELSPSGTAFIHPEDIFESGEELCGPIYWISVLPANFDCSNIGSNNVVLSVEDGNGHAHTCSAMVTVIEHRSAPGYYFDLGLCEVAPCPPGSYCPGETFAPVLCSPGSFSVAYGAVICTLCAAGSAQSLPGQTSCEECPSMSYQPEEGQVSCLDCPSGTWNNQVGQSSCVECSIQLICPESTSVQVNVEDCLYTPGDEWQAEWVSTCPIQSLSSNLNEPLSPGEFTVVWNAVDIVGNTTTCHFTLIVTDHTSPEILSCPEDLTINIEPETGALVPDFIAEVLAVDACDQAITVQQLPTPGQHLSIGLNTITLTVFDASMNSVSCIVRITTHLPPAELEVICPENIWSYLDNCEYDGVEIDYTVGTDPDYNIEYSIAPGSMFEAGETLVLITVTDAFQNTGSCTFYINISPIAQLEVYGKERLIPNESFQPLPQNDTHFGSVAPNASASRTFTLKNIGTLPLEIDTVFFTGSGASQFSVLFLEANTVPSCIGERTLRILYTGSNEEATHLAEILISTSEGEYRFALFGATSLRRMLVRGNAVAIPNGDESPNSANFTDFGTVHWGSSRTRTFTIHNSGTQTLSLIGDPRVTLSGEGSSFFTVNIPAPATIPPGGNRQFTIVFSASAIGEQWTTLSIESDDPGANPYTFTIMAQVRNPNMSVTGNNIVIESGDDSPMLQNFTDFGVRQTGSSFTQSFIVRNASGSGILALTGNPRVEITGPGAHAFSVATMPVASISSGGSSLLRITFRPLHAGVFDATVSIANNDTLPGKNPYTFAIRGATPGALPFNPEHWEVASSEEKQFLTTYPNPVRETLFVDAPVQSSPYQLELFSIDGQHMHTVRTSGGHLEIPMEKWPTGTYILYMRIEKDQSNATEMPPVRIVKGM
jgi:autotransporter-associated beta strand protein